MREGDGATGTNGDSVGRCPRDWVDAQSVVPPRGPLAASIWFASAIVFAHSGGRAKDLFEYEEMHWRLTPQLRPKGTNNERARCMSFSRASR
jgi:hypothetical protein